VRDLCGHPQQLGLKRDSTRVQSLLILLYVTVLVSLALST